MYVLLIYEFYTVHNNNNDDDDANDNKKIHDFYLSKVLGAIWLVVTSKSESTSGTTCTHGYAYKIALKDVWKLSLSHCSIQMHRKQWEFIKMGNPSKYIDLNAWKPLKIYWNQDGNGCRLD